MANTLTEQPSGESVFPTTGFGRPGSINPGQSLAVGLAKFMDARRKQRQADAERKVYEQLIAESGGLAPSVAAGGPTAAAGTPTTPGAPGAAPAAPRSKLGAVMRGLAGVATGGTSELFQKEPFGIKQTQGLTELEREIAKQIAGSKYGKTAEERASTAAEAEYRSSGAELNRAITEQIKAGGTVEWRDSTTGAVVPANTPNAIPQIVTPTKTGAPKREDVPQPTKTQEEAKLKKQVALSWVKGLSLKPKKQGVRPLPAPKSQEEAYAILPRLGVDPNDADVKEAIKALSLEADIKWIHKIGRPQYPELPTDY